MLFRSTARLRAFHILSIYLSYPRIVARWCLCINTPLPLGFHWLCDSGARWSNRLLFSSPPPFCYSIDLYSSPMPLRCVASRTIHCLSALFRSLSNAGVNGYRPLRHFLSAQFPSLLLRSSTLSRVDDQIFQPTCLLGTL